MCYTNVLRHWIFPQIPLKAADRDESCPIVIGGGACAYNPEPLAAFFDLFYIGEGETVYDALLMHTRPIRKPEAAGRSSF